ncbi:hypothetical protein HPP92_014548 [Vanilla planifolia]|uniref:DUF1990 domain-containing protein n=1 Tax=Vanilla planifolia TaxID=51239 RepID=A0A835UUP0_VANPL|nr:hypothetical protein HPP92_014997 [Vanilla planifolia]KAG0474862.1 hypothetical protein HPP92_014548 [Vanilla planifolia]
MWGDLFLTWRRPTQEQQKNCTSRAGRFNYDSSFHGASALKAEDGGLQEKLSKNGFFVNRTRVLLGRGSNTYTLAKSALLKWRHFELPWAFVDPETPVEKGRRFCVCVHELLPWVMLPLEIAYVNDVSTRRRPAAGLKASFGFGSGTLQGHLLAGEERFSIEWDDSDRVWYEIFSFSKPAHVLSAVSYPYVRLRQKHFAQESADAMLKLVDAWKPDLK